MVSDPTTDPIERAVLAAWHEFRYPRPALDEPTDAFRRAVRVALTEAGAVPGTPAATADAKLLDAIAAVREPQDFESGDAPHQPDLLNFAWMARRLASLAEFALSPAPGPDDAETDRLVRAALAAEAGAMASIAKAVGLPEDTDAEAIVYAVRQFAETVPAPGNGPQPDAPQSAYCGQCSAPPWRPHREDCPDLIEEGTPGNEPDGERTWTTHHVTATRDIPEGHTDQRVRYEYEGTSWEGWLIGTGTTYGVDEAYVMRDDGKRWVVMPKNITPIEAASLAQEGGNRG